MIDSRQPMTLFRHHVLRDVLACGRIRQAAVEIIDGFRHPGFSAYKGEGASAGDSAARKRLASHMVHVPFSLARLHYDRDAGLVSCEARASSRSNRASLSGSPAKMSGRTLMAT